MFGAPVGEDDMSGKVDRALRAIPAYARQVMDQHGLQHWTFKLDNSKRRAGVCKYRKRLISLSYSYVLNNSDEDVKDTILHEIAHALAGPGKGHGPVWKLTCLVVGAKPIRCYDPTKVVMPEGECKATCGGCGREFHRHRMPRKGTQKYCAKCGFPAGLLVYRRG